MRSPARTVSVTSASTVRRRSQATCLRHRAAARATRTGSGNSKRHSRRARARFDDRQALEHLQAALRLARLGRLGAEAVDEALQVSSRARSRPWRRRPAASAARARPARMRCSRPRSVGWRCLVDMPDRLRDAVEKFAVVRDHQHGGRLSAQPGLEPDHGVEVEMVGRLVEQQQVGRAQQRPRQRQPVAPAARERRDGARPIGNCEPETVQHGLRRGDDRAFVEFGECRVRVRRAASRRVRTRLRPARHARPSAARDLPAHSRGALAWLDLDVLCNVRDAFGPGRLDVARLESEFTEDRGEQARLAAAVGADQADALAGPRDQRNAAVQRSRTACDRRRRSASALRKSSARRVWRSACEARSRLGRVALRRNPSGQGLQASC